MITFISCFCWNNKNFFLVNEYQSKKWFIYMLLEKSLIADFRFVV